MEQLAKWFDSETDRLDQAMTASIRPYIRLADILFAKLDAAGISEKTWFAFYESR